MSGKSQGFREVNAFLLVQVVPAANSDDGDAVSVNCGRLLVIVIQTESVVEILCHAAEMASVLILSFVVISGDGMRASFSEAKRGAHAQEAGPALTATSGES